MQQNLKPIMISYETYIPKVYSTIWFYLKYRLCGNSNDSVRTIFSERKTKSKKIKLKLLAEKKELNYNSKF